nr:MAG TPA: hypothetical protein [Bacteriophage sp.]
MNKNGIDISKWNGEIDFQKAKNDGTEFVIIREGYGKKDPKQVDKLFSRNIKEAQKVGLPVGVYHYSYADSVLDAKAEAEFCLENIQGYKLEYPVVFDMEDRTQLALTNRQRTDIVKAFCSEIEKAGYYVMIYCTYFWYTKYLYQQEIEIYDLWLAQWDVPKPSIECGIWQKSDKGTIDGIKSNVDLNIAYKDYPLIIKSKGLNGFCKSSDVNLPYVTITVKKGDTLWDLANKYGTTVNQIAKDNAIKDISKIYPNQILKIKIGV